MMCHLKNLVATFSLFALVTLPINAWSDSDSEADEAAYIISVYGVGVLSTAMGVNQSSDSPLVKLLAAGIPTKRTAQEAFHKAGGHLRWFHLEQREPKYGIEAAGWGVIRTAADSWESDSSVTVEMVDGVVASLKTGEKQANDSLVKPLAYLAQLVAANLGSREEAVALFEDASRSKNDDTRNAIKTGVGIYLVSSPLGQPEADDERMGVIEGVSMTELGMLAYLMAWGKDPSKNRSSLLGLIAAGVSEERRAREIFAISEDNLKWLQFRSRGVQYTVEEFGWTTVRDAIGNWEGDSKVTIDMVDRIVDRLKVPIFEWKIEGLEDNLDHLANLIAASLASREEADALSENSSRAKNDKTREVIQAAVAIYLN